MTAKLTGSYLFSDLYVKWREIELDRESNKHALMVRREGRLESLRGFLARVWRVASAENKFDSANALLNEELRERIREAEQEWRNIDKDLLKILGAVSILELLAAGPLIASGHAYFLAAAVLLGAGMPVVNSTLKRRSFQDRFPVGFFMKIQDQ
jgi:hypothetical protein